MKFLSFLFLFFLAIPIFSEEKGRLDREEFDFRYTYLGISYIGANNADSGLAINTSFKLPGPLYLKFERRGDGWENYPNTKSRLKAKYGCYRILDFLLNDQNDSSILGLFAYGLSIDRDEKANPTFWKLVGGNKGVLTKAEEKLAKYKRGLTTSTLAAEAAPVLSDLLSGFFDDGGLIRERAKPIAEPYRPRSPKSKRKPKKPILPPTGTDPTRPKPKLPPYLKKIKEKQKGMKKGGMKKADGVMLIIEKKAAGGITGKETVGELRKRFGTLKKGIRLKGKGSSFMKEYKKRVYNRAGGGSVNGGARGTGIAVKGHNFKGVF